MSSATYLRLPAMTGRTLAVACEVLGARCQVGDAKRHKQGEGVDLGGGGVGLPRRVR